MNMIIIRQIRKKMHAVSVIIVLSLMTANAQSHSPDESKKPSRDSSELYAQQITEAKTLVLVDFYTDWCKPCKELSPMLKTISQRYRGRLQLMKINSERNPAIAAYFSVKSIPAVFLIKEKSVVKGILGLQDKKVYIDAIEEALKAP